VGTSNRWYYRAIKQEVTDIQRAVEDALGENALLSLQGTINSNLSLLRFWNPLTKLGLPDLSFDALRTVLESLRGVARQAISRKCANILEPVPSAPVFDEAVANWDAASMAVDTYNLSVTVINEAIAKLKAPSSLDVVTQRTKLSELNAVKLRYSATVADLCSNYLEAEQKKKGLDTDKRNAKQNLDDYTSKVFEKYQDKINELLAQFNTGFRIYKTKGRYVGGSPSSTFVLVINNAQVELDDNKNSPGSPCFKNTLSAGDRSSLALAFFIACLYQDPKIGEKIVVIDDPITSQDMFRATCTRQIISRLYIVAKQVIVLSHNPTFLKNLWETQFPVT
jgi:wobble nucleotide-excising tRNase